MQPNRLSRGLLVANLTIVVFMWGWFLFGLPKFVAVFDSMGQPLPAVTSMVIYLGRSFIWALFPAVGLILALKELLPNKKLTVAINAVCLLALAGLTALCCVAVYLPLHAME